MLYGVLRDDNKMWVSRKENASKKYRFKSKQNVCQKQLSTTSTVVVGIVCGLVDALSDKIVLVVVTTIEIIAPPF